MSTLLDFLTDNPVDDLTEKVIISERLKDFPFTIKAMSCADFEKYGRACRKIGKKGVVQVNEEKLHYLIAINHTVDPDFSNAKAIAKANCLTPEDFLRKSLLAGELQELVLAINKLSGFNQNIEEMIEEVKN